MAIADWIIEKSDPAMTANLEIGAPIDGTGSLHLSQLAIAPTVGVSTAHLRVLAGPPQSQFLKGKIRTLIKPINFTDTATSSSFFGIHAMMNQGQVFAAGGKAYFAGRWGGMTPSWRMSRVDNGINGTISFTHLSQGSVLNLPGLNDIRAIEFEWIFDPLEFSGVRLTLSVAPDSNFNNLATIYQVVDTTPNHLTTSVGEGLFLSALHSTPGAVLEVLYDKTANFELVPL